MRSHSEPVVTTVRHCIDRSVINLQFKLSGIADGCAVQIGPRLSAGYR